MNFFIQTFFLKKMEVSVLKWMYRYVDRPKKYQDALLYHPSPKFQVKLMLYCKSYCGEPDDPPPRSMLLLCIWKKKRLTKCMNGKWFWCMVSSIVLKSHVCPISLMKFYQKTFHDTFRMLLCCSTFSTNCSRCAICSSCSLTREQQMWHLL
jgi:hypothetical protein